jgi:hypothetical protein
LTIGTIATQYLTPTFDSETLEYTVTVGAPAYAATHLYMTITAVASEQSADISYEMSGARGKIDFVVVDSVPKIDIHNIASEAVTATLKIKVSNEGMNPTTYTVTVSTTV